MVSLKKCRHFRFGTTADVGIVAVAPTQEELFAELGRGFFALITDLGRIRPLEECEVTARADTLEGLVVSYLNELLYLHETEDWLFRRFSVTLKNCVLNAKAIGERFDPKRHPSRMMVKAITLHRLEIDIEKGRARVIIDI